jgi:hypothetical protein
MPIEAATDHRCLLGTLTDELAEMARGGTTGRDLAGEAGKRLRGLDAEDFMACCGPAYLALAPEQFDEEIQVPIASAEAGELDTRVLLWPVGAQDREHPHCDGWAAIMPMAGDLTASERRGETSMPERPLAPRKAQFLFPEQDVSHHIHNRGAEVGLSIHVFGV